MPATERCPPVHQQDGKDACLSSSRTAATRRAESPSLCHLPNATRHRHLSLYKKPPGSPPRLLWTPRVPTLKRSLTRDPPEPLGALGTLNPGPALGSRRMQRRGPGARREAAERWQGAAAAGAWEKPGDGPRAGSLRSGAGERLSGGSVGLQGLGNQAEEKWGRPLPMRRGKD